MFYISTKFGFVVDDSGHCEPDVRKAQPFDTWLGADAEAKFFVERGVFKYYAILSTQGE